MGGRPSRKFGWNPDPIRSSLHAVLVGTANATPHRYSLSQLVNTDANETAVYVVGDAFMGARVYETGL